MNPLTLVKRIQKINEKEAELGISENASWHAKYKDSPYVFVGGIPYDLTEGDLLSVFAQYGEIVDVNLIRDKGTGKSKGFAFIAYEDQRSTNLAVDNLNGAQIVGRIIKVDHVEKYKKKEEEDEETQRQKREERGVCRAFQRGECTRGAGCKFSHDEQRAANTGWGAPEDRSSKWGLDKFDGPKKSEKQYRTDMREDGKSKSHNDRDQGKPREDYKRDEKRSNHYDEELYPRPREDECRREERRTRHDMEDDRRRDERRMRRHEFEPKPTEDDHWREASRSKKREGNQVLRRPTEDDPKREERSSRRHNGGENEPVSREADHRRDEKRSRMRES